MIKDLYVYLSLPLLLIVAFFISGKFGEFSEIYHFGIYISSLLFVISFMVIVSIGIKFYRKILK